MEYTITVRQTSGPASGGRWGVFGVTAQGAELIEGGFFQRAAADRARARWERECLQSDVEDAERRAGWDPNP